VRPTGGRGRPAPPAAPADDDAIVEGSPELTPITEQTEAAVIDALADFLIALAEEDLAAESRALGAPR